MSVMDIGLGLEIEKIKNKILDERELSFNCAVLIPAHAQSSNRILECGSGISIVTTQFP